MPYGTFSEPDWTRTINCSSSNGTEAIRQYNTIGFLQRVRNGSDVNSGTLHEAGKVPKRDGTYALVPETRYNGPRLPYKVWSKRLGKYVWAREPIVVYVYKRIPTKSNPPKGLDLLPNSLDFWECKIQIQKDLNSISGHNDRYNVTHTYSGDIWSRFQLLYGSSNYVGLSHIYPLGSLSSKYTALADQLEDDLIGPLYEKVKNQTVNLAQAIAERAQTYGMISDALIRGAKAITAIRKGKLQKAAKELFPGDSKELANDWLAYQYGVKPLLSDLEGMIEQVCNEKDLVYDVVVRRRVPIDAYTVGEYTHTYYMACKETILSEGYVEVKYKTRIKVNSPSANFLSQIGFTNAQSLAWEVIPFSFVADWFLPIGGFLSNMDAFTGLEHVFTTRTVFIKEHVTRIREFGGVDHWGTSWNSGTTIVKEERTKCTRTVLPTAPPLPFPSFKDPVSESHIANAIALLRQRF